MENRLSLKRKIVLFLVLNGFYFFSYFHRVGIPGTIFNQLQIDFHLTANQVAGLGTIVLGIYGMLQFFIGPFMDFFGTNRIFVGGGFLLCLGSFLFSLSHSVFLLYFSRVLVGFGASVAFLGIVKKTDDLFGDDFFSVMLGIALFLGYSGGLFATLPFERLVAAFGWRNTIFWLSAILLVIMITILFDFSKNNLLKHQKSSISFSDIKTAILNRKSYPVIIVASINFTIYFLFQGIIGKKLLQDICQLSSKTAASFTFTMMAGAMFFVLFWGSLVHIIKKRKKLVNYICFISTFSCVLMFFNLILWKEPMIFFFSFFLFASVGGCSPLTTTIIKEINPSTVGTSVGFINGICYLLVAISGNMTGFIMDRFSSKAIVTDEAVIYPALAYVAVCLMCFFYSLIALSASFKISEVGKEQAVEIPAPI